MDGRLGDAFFDLTAIVHSILYEYQRQKLDSSLNLNDIEAMQRRRYQMVRLAKDKQGQDLTLIQFAPSGEDSSYFRNYCHRINAAGWNTSYFFPSHVRAISIYLRAADLRGVDLRGANLSRADLSRAKLSRANLSTANLRGANLSRADLTGANAYGADLTGAKISPANLFVAYLSTADFRGANLRKANLKGANLKGAKLRGADLRNVKTIKPEQIKQANHWELAYFDEEMKVKLEL